jgi:hypothetical protein
MFIEGLRTDSLYIGVFRISQVVGFLCFTICTTLMVLMLYRQRRKALDAEVYVDVYEKSRGLGISFTKGEEETTEESEEN